MADLSIHKLHDLALERAMGVRQAGTKSLWIAGGPSAIWRVIGCRLKLQPYPWRVFYTRIVRRFLQISQVLNGNSHNAEAWYRRFPGRMGQPMEERPAVLVRSPLPRCRNCCASTTLSTISMPTSTNLSR